MHRIASDPGQSSACLRAASGRRLLAEEGPSRPRGSRYPVHEDPVLCGGLQENALGGVHAEGVFPRIRQYAELSRLRKSEKSIRQKGGNRRLEPSSGRYQRTSSISRSERGRSKQPLIGLKCLHRPDSPRVNAEDPGSWRGSRRRGLPRSSASSVLGGIPRGPRRDRYQEGESRHEDYARGGCGPSAPWETPRVGSVRPRLPPSSADTSRS